MIASSIDSRQSVEIAVDKVPHGASPAADIDYKGRP